MCGEWNRRSTVSPSPKASWLCTAVTAFKILWDLMKQVRDNQMANLEGPSKAGQSKPSFWVRKRGSETGWWLTHYRSASQLPQTPVGSRYCGLTTGHAGPTLSTLATPLTGLPHGNCRAAWPCSPAQPSPAQRHTPGSTLNPSSPLSIRRRRRVSQGPVPE